MPRVVVIIIAVAMVVMMMILGSVGRSIPKGIEISMKRVAFTC
jgi:uncharacterized protein YoxC